MPSIVLGPGHARDIPGLCLVRIFLESICGDRLINLTKQHGITDVKTVMNTFQSGIKKEITDFNEDGEWKMSPRDTW